MLKAMLKSAAQAVFLRPGSIRRIRFGPLRGMTYRVGPITGLAAWYSGAERKVQTWLRNLAAPGACAIDVGANWGVHTLYLSRLVGPSGQVVAVECFPDALAELEWHVQANRCSNVRIIRAALGESDGQAAFQLGHSATSGKLVSDAPREGKAIQVAVRSLDSLAAEHALRPAFVKIDVEGAEGRVLAGADRVTAACRPAFLIELHNPEQDLCVARWLTERGYALERITPPPIVHVDKSWPEPQGVWGTIVARPQESRK